MAYSASHASPAGVLHLCCSLILFRSISARDSVHLGFNPSDLSSHVLKRVALLNRFMRSFLKALELALSKMRDNPAWSKTLALYGTVFRRNLNFHHQQPHAGGF